MRGQVTALQKGRQLPRPTQRQVVQGEVENWSTLHALFPFQRGLRPVSQRFAFGLQFAGS